MATCEQRNQFSVFIDNLPQEFSKEQVEYAMHTFRREGHGGTVQDLGLFAFGVKKMLSKALVCLTKW